MSYLSIAALLAVSCAVLVCQTGGERSDYAPRAVTTVRSTQLAETKIVPTLNTPLGKSGNAVWCATFQVAWNRSKDKVIGGPLQIANAQPVADRLNSSPVTEAAMPPDSYFAEAGRIDDGIVESIHHQMARQFPSVQPPRFEGAVGFVTYGYMHTTARFTMPFSDTKIQFADAAGGNHLVNGFGLHQGSDWDLLDKQARQVKILFTESDDEFNQPRQNAFALDLTADQSEQEVIVAMLPRATHLCGALDDLEKRIASSTPDQLLEVDRMMIPNVAFSVDHDFAELEGDDKLIENPGEFQGLFIASASQSINFRLDKSGATVVSESHVAVGAMPREFIVDRPFLIVMKRRSEVQPYFVAWVENAELLEASR